MRKINIPFPSAAVMALTGTAEKGLAMMTALLSLLSVLTTALIGGVFIEALQTFKEYPPH